MEGLVLTEVEGTISNPMGVSLVLLCEKCRRGEPVSDSQKKCIFSCAANPKLVLKLKN
jgi:hypothetical protein